MLEGELIIKTLVQEASKIKTQIAKNFHDTLVRKVNDRRNVVITSLSQYLLNRDFLGKSTVDSYPLELSTKKAAQQLLTKILKRLFKYDEEQTSGSDVEIVEELNVTTTFGETLKQQIDNQWAYAISKEKPSCHMSGIQKDLRYFEQHQVRSPLIEKLFFALCSAQPTSTQTERNFSLAASFVSKLRTSLTDKNVDVLCFLKSFFLESYEK